MQNSKTSTIVQNSKITAMLQNSEARKSKIQNGTVLELQSTW